MATRSIVGYAGHKRLESIDFSTGKSKDILGSDLRRVFQQKKSALLFAFDAVADRNGTVDADRLAQVWIRAGVTVDGSDLGHIAGSLQAGNNNGIQRATFRAFLNEHANFDIPTKSTKDSGSRIPGYSGHRRRSTQDASVGISAAKLVSADVRQRIAGKGEDFEALFGSMDRNGDKELNYKELVGGLQRMNVGLNNEQCKAIYYEMVQRGSSKQIRTSDFCSWMNSLEPPNAQRGQPFLPAITAPVTKQNTLRNQLLHRRSSIAQGLASRNTPQTPW